MHDMELPTLPRHVLRCQQPQQVVGHVLYPPILFAGPIEVRDISMQRTKLINDKSLPTLTQP